MARRKRLAVSKAGTAVASKASTSESMDLAQIWKALTKPRGKVKQKGMKPHEMTFLLSNLSTLVSNGVPLPKAIATMGKEESLSKHHHVLETLRRKIESGQPFSTALGNFPEVCDKITVNQIRLGERSGTLADTLEKLSKNRNKTAELRKDVVKKMAYPTMLVVVGSVLITFLLVYVVPVFQVTYEEAGVPLPYVTQFMISVGAIVKGYGLIVIGLVAAFIASIKHLRKRDDFALSMDRFLLRLPMIGKLFRDMAVLQLMEVLQNLMEAGYTLAEALRDTADSVGNRAVRKGVRELQAAVQRGERFSREMERHEEMFPPMVNQLVVIGESTGQLTRATEDICNFLHKEVERKTSLMVGALEPILTLSLASAIAVLLLAIYLPMFDLVGHAGQ